MMAGTPTLRVRRSRGALSGVLLVLLGLWGALIPFVGPYFRYAYSPDRAWHVTAGRLWLEVLPGAVTLACGVVVLISRLRPVAVFAAWLAIGKDQAKDLRYPQDAPVSRKAAAPAR